MLPPESTTQASEDEKKPRKRVQTITEALRQDNTQSKDCTLPVEESIPFTGGRGVSQSWNPFTKDRKTPTAPWKARLSS